MSDVDVVGAAEACAILDVELQRISRWRKAGKLPPPYANLAASPVWLRADIEKVKKGQFDFAAPPDPAPLVGTAEAAQILGVNKSQITRWRTRPTRTGLSFPDPVARIKAGPIWDRGSIEQFAAERQARKGDEGE